MHSHERLTPRGAKGNRSAAVTLPQKLTLLGVSALIEGPVVAVVTKAKRHKGISNQKNKINFDQTNKGMN